MQIDLKNNKNYFEKKKKLPIINYIKNLLRE